MKCFLKVMEYHQNQHTGMNIEPRDNTDLSRKVQKKILEKQRCYPLTQGLVHKITTVKPLSRLPTIRCLISSSPNRIYVGTQTLLLGYNTEASLYPQRWLIPPLHAIRAMLTRESALCLFALKGHKVIGDILIGYAFQEAPHTVFPESWLA